MEACSLTQCWTDVRGGEQKPHGIQLSPQARPQNNECHRTKHGPDGASPPISVLSRPSDATVISTVRLALTLLVLSGCASNQALRRPIAHAEASCAARTESGLAVVVYDLSGVALPGVHVAVADEGRRELAIRETDHAGRATFPTMPAQTSVVVRAQLPGFSNSIAAVTTRGDCATLLKMPLIVDLEHMDCLLDVWPLPKR